MNEVIILNRIKELRKKHNLSQYKLAEMLNVHQTAISQWETGRTNPDIATAKKIADIFKTTTDYIFGRDFQGNSKDVIIPKDLIEKAFCPTPAIEAIISSWVDQLKDDFENSFLDKKYLVFEENLSDKKRDFIRKIENMSDDQIDKLEQILAIVESKNS